MKINKQGKRGLLSFVAISLATLCLVPSALAKYRTEVSPPNGMLVTLVGEPPTMADGSSWFRDKASKKSTITYVRFTKELPGDVTFESTWDASEVQNGGVTAALDGTILYISSNGAEKIIANEDSSTMFATWSSLQGMTGTELLDTSNVTDMTSMFYGCTSLSSLNISTWNTKNVTSAMAMFAGNTSLETLHFPLTGMGQLQNGQNMFSRCKKLSDINFSGFEKSVFEQASVTGMFSQTGADVSALNITVASEEMADTMRTMDALNLGDYVQFTIAGAEEQP